MDIDVVDTVTAGDSMDVGGDSMDVGRVDSTDVDVEDTVEVVGGGEIHGGAAPLPGPNWIKLRAGRAPVLKTPPVWVGPTQIPRWAVPSADEPAWLFRNQSRVVWLKEVRGNRDSLLRQMMETTTRQASHRKGVIREVRVGNSTAPPQPSGAPGGVGFVVTVPMESPRTAPAESRTPVQFVRSLVQSMGGWEQAASRLRVVIGINRWNDPREDTSTERVESELAVEVDDWQAQLNQQFPGVAVVVGHLVELGVREDVGGDHANRTGGGGWWTRMCCASSGAAGRPGSSKSSCCFPLPRRVRRW